MATGNERQSVEMVSLTNDEMQTVQGGAQVDYFLKLDGIPGESASTSSQRPIRGGGDVNPTVVLEYLVLA